MVVIIKHANYSRQKQFIWIRQSWKEFLVYFIITFCVCDRRIYGTVMRTWWSGWRSSWLRRKGRGLLSTRTLSTSAGTTFSNRSAGNVSAFLIYTPIFYLFVFFPLPRPGSGGTFKSHLSTCNMSGPPPSPSLPPLIVNPPIRLICLCACSSVRPPECICTRQTVCLCTQLSNHISVCPHTCLCILAVFQPLFFF